MTKSELRQIIKEEISNVTKKKLLKEETFYDQMKKVNPGWGKERAMKMVTGKFDLEDAPGFEDEAEEQKQDAIEWFSKIEKSSPTVKIGDKVKVYARSNKKQCIGIITGETIMEGNYAYMGKVSPDKIPAWIIDAYREGEGEKGGKNLFYKGKNYWFAGALQYPKYEEGESDTFSKLL